VIWIYILHWDHTCTYIHNGVHSNHKAPAIESVESPQVILVRVGRNKTKSRLADFFISDKVEAFWWYGSSCGPKHHFPRRDMIVGESTLLQKRTLTKTDYGQAEHAVGRKGGITMVTGEITMDTGGKRKNSVVKI